MTSFYPRTETVWLNSMELYHEALREGGSAMAAAGAVVERVAEEVCAGLERVLALPAVMRREVGPAVYEWLAAMPGGENGVAGREQAGRLYREKVAKGLL
jgi:hypothetical protein